MLQRIGMQLILSLQCAPHHGYDLNFHCFTSGFVRSQADVLGGTIVSCLHDPPMTASPHNASSVSLSTQVDAAILEASKADA